MNTTVEQKKAIRKSILDIRNNITNDYIISSSEKITHTLLNTDVFIKAKTIMCYISFGAEVATRPIIDECFKQGKTILIPIIIKNVDGTPYMEASELLNPVKDLAPGTMGILEPKVSSMRIRDPKSIDLIVIPGLAFDKLGNRLGYGAGYYDYFLKRLNPDCIQIAITFSFQILNELPTEDHDKPIPNILTEIGLNKTNPTNIYNDT